VRHFWLGVRTLPCWLDRSRHGPVRIYRSVNKARPLGIAQGYHRQPSISDTLPFAESTRLMMSKDAPVESSPAMSNQFGLEA